MLKSGLQSKEVVIPISATVKGRKQGKLNKSKQLQVAFSLYTSIKMVTFSIATKFYIYLKCRFHGMYEYPGIHFVLYTHTWLKKLNFVELHSTLASLSTTSVSEENKQTELYQIKWTYCIINLEIHNRFGLFWFLTTYYIPVEPDTNFNTSICLIVLALLWWSWDSRS